MLCSLCTQEFLPDVKLLIDVAEMRRSADHPRVQQQQQGQAPGGRLDLMVHVLSWQRMVSLSIVRRLGLYPSCHSSHA
jgi:hypothetical protein